MIATTFPTSQAEMPSFKLELPSANTTKASLAFQGDGVLLPWKVISLCIGWIYWLALHFNFCKCPLEKQKCILI